MNSPDEEFQADSGKQSDQIVKDEYIFTVASESITVKEIALESPDEKKPVSASPSHVLHLAKFENSRRLQAEIAPYVCYYPEITSDWISQRYHDLQGFSLQIIPESQNRSPVQMLFDEQRGAQRLQAFAVDVSQWPQEQPIWFLGDLHGDFLALETALYHIVSSTAGDEFPSIVFLGDLVDDGAYSHEVILRFFKLLHDYPGKITLIAGNHDEAINYANNKFTSTVSPSDYTVFLESRSSDSFEAMVARQFINIVKDAPRALFLSSGLFVAHGGIPLSDTWGSLSTIEDLNASQCLTDFVWTRAHERAKMKIPNRNSRGSEFGINDLYNFGAKVAQILGEDYRPGCMLRGHTHVADRVAIYSRYKECPVVTINTLSCRLPREILGPFARDIAVAKWTKDSGVTVETIHLNPSTINDMHTKRNESEDGQD